MGDGSTSSSPAVVPQHSLLGGAENIKLLFDEELDNRRETSARARAWEDIALRRATNGATFDHAINAGIVLAGQVGTTEGQQTVSPAGTASAEAIKGAVGVAAAGQAVNAEALTTALGQIFSALVAVIVTASGGASTPSQTKPPTAT